MEFTRRGFVSGALGASANAFLPCAANTATQPAMLVLGTATPGGGFPAYAAALLDALNAVDPEFLIEARHTKGSIENVPLLERGELDLGLVTGEVLYEALAGVRRAPSDVKVVSAMYSQAGMFALRADHLARGIGDLRRQPVVFGAAGSGLVVLARYVLDGLGLDMERDFQAIFLERAGDGPAMVLDGRAAALWGAGSGWPGFNAVANAPSGARFIVPSESEAKAIVAKHPFLKALTVPAGSYPGLDVNISSVGSWSFIVARHDLDDARAYRFARALHRAEARFVEKPQTRETTIANTLASIAGPELLHPGVARFFRELGVLQR